MCVGAHNFFEYGYVFLIHQSVLECSSHFVEERLQSRMFVLGRFYGGYYMPNLNFCLIVYRSAN